MFQAVASAHTVQNSDRDLLITVLLADDSEIVRRGIRQLLATRNEIEIVAEAADYAQTIQLANDLKPRLIVMDLHMPEEFKASSQDIKSHLHCGSEILAISFSNDEDTMALARNFGATVLLDKISLADTLIPTIVRLGQRRRTAVAS
jgi:DNA-binding NarL/FixJ family response regulator